MSAFDNVVGGKLKLKGKALDVKAGGMKKKKKQKKQFEQVSQAVESEFSASLLVFPLNVFCALSCMSRNLCFFVQYIFSIMRVLLLCRWRLL